MSAVSWEPLTRLHPHRLFVFDAQGNLRGHCNGPTASGLCPWVDSGSIVAGSGLAVCASELGEEEGFTVSPGATVCPVAQAQARSTQTPLPPLY